MNRFGFYLACSVALILVLAGCTTYDDALTLKNGARGYRVYCGGFPFSSAHDCEDRAASLCSPGTYTMLTDEGVPYSHTQALWDLSTRQILVQCNKTQ